MPRPIDTFGDELKSVALYSESGRALGAKSSALLDALAIRDTAQRDLLADVSGYPRKTFACLNLLNQAVTLSIGFSASGSSFVATAGLASGIVLAANSSLYIGAEGSASAGFFAEPRLANYVEGVYLSIVAASAPTSGSLSIYLMTNAF